MEGEKFHVVRYAMDKLFAEGAPYSAREIAVVLAVARHMNRETRDCFVSYGRIGRQAKVSTRDVQRILARHCDNSPAPLLARKFAGETRGKVHRCYRFELVLNPEAFAVERDAQPKTPKRVRRKPQPHPTAARPTLAAVLAIAPRPPKPPRDKARKLTKAESPWIGECACNNVVARWSDGTVQNADGTTHVCTTKADRTGCPTNTRSDSTTTQKAVESC